MKRDLELLMKILVVIEESDDNLMCTNVYDALPDYDAKLVQKHLQLAIDNNLLSHTNNAKYMHIDHARGVVGYHYCNISLTGCGHDILDIARKPWWSKIKDKALQTLLDDPLSFVQLVRGASDA